MELKTHAGKLEERHYAWIEARNASIEAGNQHPFNPIHPNVLKTNFGMARAIGKTTIELIKLAPHVRELYLIHKGKLPKIEA